MQSVEVQLNEALDLVKMLTKENADLKVAVTEQRYRAARAEREIRFRGAGLPQPARERLHAAFAKSTDNAGLKEAINVELRRGAK
jgi:hypothetical protein